MKNRFFICATLILFCAPAMVAGQTLSDYCHVNLIDMKVAEKALQKYPTGDNQKDSKLLTSGISIVGRFSPKMGEEQLTTKSYPLPGTDQIITASVFHTDERMFSTRSKTVDSMLVGIVVSKKALDSAFEAQNNAVAEITYTEQTDTVRVKTLARVQGRQYIVGLECRCNREFDETDQKRQAK
jgi:hypothetical protein